MNTEALTSGAASAADTAAVSVALAEVELYSVLAALAPTIISFKVVTLSVAVVVAPLVTVNPETNWLIVAWVLPPLD